MKVVLVTGGFDPLHSGHIAYFTAAKKLGDKLVVGLNSDEWLTRKKGRRFIFSIMVNHHMSSKKAVTNACTQLLQWYWRKA